MSLNLNSKLAKQKIYEAWSPKIKSHLKSKGIENISEAKLQKMCEASQVRKLFENATTGNTPGRGAFNLGNNTGNANDSAKGSGEVFDQLFGVFIDTYSTTAGFDILDTKQMTKSNLLVKFLEPVYADGKIGATAKEDMPELFQVKTSITGTVADLVSGQTYGVTAGDGGAALVDLIYVGKDRANKGLIFRLGAVTGTGALKTLLDSATNNAGIYTDATNYIEFDPATIGYVNAYTNFIQGYAGSGINDDKPWEVNRSIGTSVANAMGRETGEGNRFRSMGLNQWSENFSAETYQVKIGYTTEMLQDLAMEEGIDAQAVAYDTIANELEQNFNNEIIDKHYAIGWGHHADIFETSGVNFNIHLSATAQASATAFVDETETSRSIDPAQGVLASTTNGDNLPSLQRRIVSRTTFVSGAIGQKSRKGKGNTAITNYKNSSAIQDIRGFQLAPFENSVTENENAYNVGSFRKMNLFEDPMLDASDTRISVGLKGDDKTPGYKMLNYILGERISTIAEGTMQEVAILKSRSKIAKVGTNPQFSYLTFTVTEGTGQSII